LLLVARMPPVERRATRRSTRSWPVDLASVALLSNVGANLQNVERSFFLGLLLAGKTHDVRQRIIALHEKWRLPPHRKTLGGSCTMCPPKAAVVIHCRAGTCVLPPLRSCPITPNYEGTLRAITSVAARSSRAHDIATADQSYSCVESDHLPCPSPPTRPPANRALDA